MKCYIPSNHSREIGLNTRHPFLSLRNDVEDLFNNWFLSSPNAADATAAAFVPKLDVVDKESHYKVMAELPGLSEDDIEITIDDDLLTIRGEKTNKVEKEENNRYYCERSYGSFERRVQLSEQVNSEEIDAKFTKGILEITLPKLAEEKRRSRKVEVRSE